MQLPSVLAQPHLVESAMQSTPLPPTAYFSAPQIETQAILTQQSSMSTASSQINSPSTLRGPGFGASSTNTQAEKAKSSYGVLESVLSALKPAVQDNIPFCIPDREHQAGVLEQAMADFRDSFLLVKAPSEMATLVTKGDRKVNAAQELCTVQLTVFLASVGSRQ